MQLIQLRINYRDMNKKILLIIAAIAIIFSIPVSKTMAAEIKQNVYMIKGKESLDSIAVKLLPRYKVKYGKRIEDFKKDLVEWNTHITNWERVPLFSNIYIEYPYPAHISYPYSPKLAAGTNYAVLNADAETPIGNNRFTVFGMYTASAGDFQESIKTQEGSIKSTQNSPLSLGLGTTIFLDKTNRMLSASTYWSRLQASKLSGEGVQSNQLKTNAEIGFNIYYQQLTPWAELSLYGGVDYEKFSTFNTSAFLEGENLAFNENKLIYATLGFGRTFFIKDFKLLIKSSIAQSVKSDTTSLNVDDKFKGQRFLLFASIKGESRFTYHLIYKRHMLEGPTELTINRIGLGLGFVIF